MDVRYHGRALLCSSICTTGNHTGIFGEGSISISSRNEENRHAIDIGKVYFAEPTEAQRLDAETTPFLSTNGDKASKVNRRLSRIQAHYITELIIQALNDELRGVIPSDSEIKARIDSEIKARIDSEIKTKLSNCGNGVKQ
jgi:hypothetical protein